MAPLFMSEGIPVARNDTLFIRLFHPFDTGGTVSLLARIVVPSGEFFELFDPLVMPVGGGGVFEFRRPLTEGTLVFATLYFDNAGLQHRVLFGRVTLHRGQEVDTVQGYPLMGGMLGELSFLRWPGPLQTQPYQQWWGPWTQLPVNPAAGTDLSVNVGSAFDWLVRRVLAVRFQFVTSAVIATRQPVLELTQGAAVPIARYVAPTQTASLTRVYTFAGTVSESTADVVRVNVAFDGLDLPIQGLVATRIVGLQAGDQISNVSIVQKGAFLSVAF